MKYFDGIHIPITNKILLEFPGATIIQDGRVNDVPSFGVNCTKYTITTSGRSRKLSTEEIWALNTDDIEGELIYNTTDHEFWFWNGGDWRTFTMPDP